MAEALPTAYWEAQARKFYPMDNPEMREEYPGFADWRAALLNASAAWHDSTEEEPGWQPLLTDLSSIPLEHVPVRAGIYPCLEVHFRFPSFSQLPPYLRVLRTLNLKISLLVPYYTAYMDVVTRVNTGMRIGSREVENVVGKQYVGEANLQEDERRIWEAMLPMVQRHFGEWQFLHHAALCTTEIPGAVPYTNWPEDKPAFTVHDLFFETIHSSKVIILD